MNTTAMQFVNSVHSLESSGNITIPMDQLPVIQSSIIQTSAEVAVLFFFIGCGMTAVFAYLYFRMWKKLNFQDAGDESSKKSELVSGDDT